MASIPTDIELDDEERTLLADAAKRTGKPWRSLLREAIARFIKAETEPSQISQNAPQESLLQKLERLGAVGMIVGGPPDLSTNKKYMEGFGQDT
jgi:hypothetical protein